MKDVSVKILKKGNRTNVIFLFQGCGKGNAVWYISASPCTIYQWRSQWRKRTRASVLRDITCRIYHSQFLLCLFVSEMLIVLDQMFKIFNIFNKLEQCYITDLFLTNFMQYFCSVFLSPAEGAAGYMVIVSVCPSFRPTFLSGT